MRFARPRIAGARHRSVRGKPEGAGRRGRRMTKGIEAGLVEQRPRRVDAAEPLPDGRILEHARSDHRQALPQATPAVHPHRLDDILRELHQRHLGQHSKSPAVRGTGIAAGFATLAFVAWL